MNVTYIVKFIAGITGAFGIAIIFISFHFRPSDTDIFEIISTLSIALLGLVLVLISYDVIKKFSLKSIQTLCALISLVFVGTLISFFKNVSFFNEHELIGIILTLISAIIIYELMIHFIIKRCNFGKNN